MTGRLGMETFGLRKREPEPTFLGSGIMVGGSMKNCVTEPAVSDEDATVVPCLLAAFVVLVVVLLFATMRRLS